MWRRGGWLCMHLGGVHGQHALAGVGPMLAADAWGLAHLARPVPRLAAPDGTCDLSTVVGGMKAETHQMAESLAALGLHACRQVRCFPYLI